MKNRILSFAALLSGLFILTGCPKPTSIAYNGQLKGVIYGQKINMARPYGMVPIPQGDFLMGSSDEDINHSLNSKKRHVSIKGFWMDATEITNSEYKQFVNWVRDSIAATILQNPCDTCFLDRKQMATMWKDPQIIDKISQIITPPADRLPPLFIKTINADSLVFLERTLDYKKAAYRTKNEKIENFIDRKRVPVYPDTLVWVRDFHYSYNEPMSKRYFDHPAFANYPVVGVTWVQASAFCTWRSEFLNTFLYYRKFATESSFRLPTEAEWEYAARGGRSQALFPWGNYYLRNRKGCLMANFKPGRGQYATDGGYYTVRADAYWPNDWGLYNMAGNVAEWTSSHYDEAAANITHDMNPDFRYNAKKEDPLRMKRKVLRGGSWKDIGYFLQTGTRSYEYQDTAKSFIGFRCVIDLPAGIR